MADSSKSRGDGKPARAASSSSESEAEELVVEETGEVDDELTEAVDDDLVDADDSSEPGEGEEALADEAPVSAPKPAKRHQTVAPVKKAKPTPKQSEAKKTDHKRTTLVQFIKQAIGELKKVVWPTAATTRQYFVVVLVFVLFIMAFVAGLDALFGWLLLLWLA